MTRFAAVHASAGLDNDDFRVALLVSLGGVMLSPALLSVDPDAFAILGAC
jgi:hypothetical protein